jgi:hypothetical protein
MGNTARQPSQDSTQKMSPITSLMMLLGRERNVVAAIMVIANIWSVVNNAYLDRYLSVSTCA